MANIQKDSYAAGETAVLVLEIRNESEAAFESIELSLKRTVTLTAGGRIQKLEEDVAKTKFSQGACVAG